MEYSVRFCGDTLQYGPVRLRGVEGIGIARGVTVVLGPNGAGKSTLGLVLEKGRHAFNNRMEFTRADCQIRMITFTDIHSLTGIDVIRHTQRLEATENEFVPTVAEVVARFDHSPADFDRLSRRFELADVMEKKINYLSSGELRKLLLINVLLSRPGLLIIDNPYIGLDAQSRRQLDDSLSTLASEGLSIVMLLCDPIDIPSYADSVILLENLTFKAQINDPEGIRRLRQETLPAVDSLTASDLPPRRRRYPDFTTAFSITDGHIRYGGRSIFEHLDWKVARGERWALTGPNGSGKTLLLSCVCGDHPQAYANNIVLFDRRRGTGESIWDIKDKIGYVTPEQQLYFRSVKPVEEIVVQGMRNMLERYNPVTAEELEDARRWLQLLDISHLADRQFSTLSSGEQRLVMLATALVKQPPLLILDEPLHGLDAARKERVRRIIDAMMQRDDSSLIFVTHYQREIPPCVDHTLTLRPTPADNTTH